MSQVRKFQGGGETAAPTKQESSTAKTYKLIINGREINLDQDGLAEFRKAGSGQGGMMGNVYADIADALESGRTVKYNSDSNTIYGVDFKRVDPKAIFKANENQVWDRRAQRRANRYARRNNLTHQFNSALASIGSINFVKRKEDDTTSSDSSSKLSLFGSYNPFQYNTDDRGNTTFANSPLNATAKKYIDAYANLATLTREQAKEKYNFDDEKYDQFMNWYNAYGQNYNWIGEGDSLWNRIQNKNYNENDDKLLALLGWNIDNSSGNSSGSTNILRSYEGSGVNNDWLTRNNYYVQKGSDGNTYLYRLGTDENGKPKYLIDTSAKIYLPNMGILGDNSQWNGGAIINGRFYTENEIWDPNSTAGQSFAELTRAWNSGSGEVSWQNAKNTGWRFAGSDADNYMFSAYDRNTGTNPLWDQYFDKYKDDDNIWYVRNLANNFSDIPEGMEIISYIDQNNRAKAGYENPYFAVYNPLDKQFKRFKDEEALSSYLQGLPGLNIRKQNPLYSGDANFDIYDFLFDKNKNKYSYVSPIHTFTGTGSSQQSTELYRGPDGNYYYLLDNSNPEDLQFIRIDDQNVVNQILNGQIISNENLPSWAKRRLLERGKRKYMKQGGKIDFNKINYLRKHQYGGIFSNPYTGSTNKKERNKDTEITIGDAHQAFGGGKYGVRTKADKLANWATGFDTAAVGTSFVPVYGNIVGAASGLTGSALRFASDVKKDGFQGKDLWKFLGNVGLDILTLIPGLGSAAAGVKAAKGASKVAKVASTVAKGAGKVAKWGDNTKMGKLVTVGLPVSGAVNGATAAIEAATSGEPITTDQLQTIAGGLMGGVILGSKAGKFINKKALKSVQKELGLKPTPYKYEVDGKTAVLTKEEAQDLSKKKVADVNEFLYKKIKKAGIELEKPDFETSTLWKEFGISGNVSRKGPWGLWGNRLKVKQRKPNSSDLEFEDENLAKRLANPKSWKERWAQKAYSEEILQNPELATFVRKVTGAKVRPQGQWTFGGWGTNWINRVKPKVSTPPITPVTPKRSTANSVNPIQPAKYSRTPSKSTKRNIGLEQTHKLKVLQEAGRQQAPAIRGLQEDIAKVRTSEDFKNLLVKINNRGSYKEIIKNNPEIKDQLRQMFVRLDPVRLGNWMTKYNLRFKKGGKIIKAQPGVSLRPGDLIMDNDLNDNLYDYQKHGIIVNGNNIDWDKTYKMGSDFDTIRQVYISNWNNPDFADVKRAYINQLSSNNNNIDLTKFSLQNFEDYTSDKKLGWAHKLRTNAFDNYISMLPAAEVTAKAPEAESKISTQSQVVGKQGAGSPVGVTKSDREFNWNPDDLIGLANLGYSVHKNNQMYGVLDDSIRKAGRALQKQMPTEIYDRYQDHITPIYQEAANKKRQFIPISTDSLLNYIMRQTNEDVVQALLTEGRLKASEQYTNYLDKDLAARRIYADQRRQIADTNRSLMANIIMQLGQNDAARRLANNQSIQNYVGEMRTKLAQDRQKKKQFQLQDAQVQAQNAYNAKYNEFGNKWMQEFAELRDTDKEKYGTWEGYWQTKDINSYNDAIEKASIAARNIMQTFYPTQLDYFRYRPTQLVSPTTRTVRYGKGGKTPKYTQRHTGQKPDEAIWIQRNKDTAKALEKLHDAVIKLFMKALS